MNDQNKMITGTGALMHSGTIRKDERRNVDGL